MNVIRTHEDVEKRHWLVDTDRCSRPPRQRGPSACSRRWCRPAPALRRGRTPSWCWRWARRRAAGSARGSGPNAAGSQSRPAPGCQTPPHLGGRVRGGHYRTGNDKRRWRWGGRTGGEVVFIPFNQVKVAILPLVLITIITDLLTHKHHVSVTALLVLFIFYFNL